MPIPYNLLKVFKPSKRITSSYQHPAYCWLQIYLEDLTVFDCGFCFIEWVEHIHTLDRIGPHFLALSDWKTSTKIENGPFFCSVTTLLIIFYINRTAVRRPASQRARLQWEAARLLRLAGFWQLSTALIRHLSAQRHLFLPFVWVRSERW